MKTERVIYQGIDCEVLRSKSPLVDTVILQGRNFGKVIKIVELENLGKTPPKKPKGETWKLMYNGAMVMQHLNWIICETKRKELLNDPAFQKYKPIIV